MRTTTCQAAGPSCTGARAPPCTVHTRASANKARATPAPRSRVAAAATPAPTTFSPSVGRLLGTPVPAPTATAPGVTEGFWQWDACPTGAPQRIRYQHAPAPPGSPPAPGTTRPPALLLIHGFGGNADHWRKNTPAIAAAGFDVWAIDLLGYGFSDKPSPKKDSSGTPRPPASLYCFETWARQVLDFRASVIQAPVFLITNSVGGLVGLQAALDAEQGLVQGVQLMNISLRALHVSKQAPLARPAVAALQWALRETPLGGLFFGQVATPEGVASVLKQCYKDTGAVSADLVSAILSPATADPAAATAVFLDFISYSNGPLPEDLLAAVGRERPGLPVSVIWGAADPWEKVEWGRTLGDSKTYPCVESYVEVDAGHCPMDEAPGAVNPLVVAFVRKHTAA
jgi:pimeloyl-ACP methyl ester carboxylesterase